MLYQMLCSKKVYLEVSAEKTLYVITRNDKARWIVDIKTAIKSFIHVENLKYFETIITDYSIQFIKKSRADKIRGTLFIIL